MASFFINDWSLLLSNLTTSLILQCYDEKYIEYTEKEYDEIRHGSISGDAPLHLSPTSYCKLFSSKIQFRAEPFRTKSKSRNTKVLSVRAQRTLSHACLCDRAQQCDDVSKLLGENRIAVRSGNGDLKFEL